VTRSGSLPPIVPPPSAATASRSATAFTASGGLVLVGRGFFSSHVPTLLGVHAATPLFTSRGWTLLTQTPTRNVQAPFTTPSPSHTGSPSTQCGKLNGLL
jgi:hypothetical protein